MKRLIVQRNGARFGTRGGGGEGVVLDHILGTFDLVVFKVMLGSFGAIVLK